MKNLLNVGSIIFFIGFFIKFFHIHYNAVVMLAGLFMLLVASLVAIVKKEGGVNGWAHLAATFWLALLLFTIKFYPFVTVVLTLTVASTIISLIAIAKAKTWKASVFPAICMVLAITFYLTPADNKYRLMNVRWNYEIDTDFATWDKYSWFLYQSGKYEEALDASNTALRIASEAGDTEWGNFIADHRSRIEQRSWTTFR
ncbi:hypothetical protein [uncultured Imperialibacter sp.]|uniref:hypothetical protein n=1 Tax=uncultured Imperialibacter sp. TaxID=1672639 RepID=UPI0030DB9EB4|tara:strand:+ start:16914 stop:17513 length:600 start_codon:yes stop_codon:yes gene_type:complete